MNTFASDGDAPGKGVRRQDYAGWRRGLGRRRTRRCPLAVEFLEDRTVLSPTLFTVTSTGDSPGAPHTATSGDLRYCVGLANANTNLAGSVVEFDPTVFATPQTITLSPALGTLEPTGSHGPEVISGPGASLVTISGNNSVGVFHIPFNVGASPITITGLTVTGGVAQRGGGVDNEGTLTLDSCTIADNTAATTSSTFTDGGGGIYNSGSLVMHDDDLVANAAIGSSPCGGAIFNANSIQAFRCNLVSNHADAAKAHGGAVYNTGIFQVDDSIVRANVSGGDGGGIYSDDRLNVTSSTISENTAQGTSSGGMYTSAWGDSGGGVFNGNASTATLTDSTVTSNNAQCGGGLYNDGNMTLSNTTVAFNTVTGGDYIESGAGILEDGGWPAAPATLVTVGATIAYNKGPTVAGWGGGLDVVIMYLISGG